MDEERPFGEKYVLSHKLAEGGMAELYLARQLGLGGFQKELVIKRILPDLADNERYVEMLMDEARIAADLNHPNIVHIYDIGHAEGTYYIAMEFIDGADLMDICKQGVKRSMFLPLEHAIKIIGQVSEALIYAHSRVDEYGEPLGIVHRDISPNNILVSYDGVAKLVDFGIAKANIVVRQEGTTAAGKANYMAPEQLSGQDVDHRADLFALGVVLYEITVGRRLFKGKPDEAARKIVNEPIPPPTFVRQDYPVELEQIVVRLLERRPEDRYQSADELHQDLEDFLASNNMRTGTVRISHYLRELYDLEVALPAGTQEPLEEDEDLDFDRDALQHKEIFDEDFDDDRGALVFASRLPTRAPLDAADQEPEPETGSPDDVQEAAEDLAKTIERPAPRTEPVPSELAGDPGPPEPETHGEAAAADNPPEAATKSGWRWVLWTLFILALCTGAAWAAFRFWPKKTTAKVAKDRSVAIPVKLESRPSKAKILVDGKTRGTTPATLQLTKSEHVLELRHSRQAPWKWPLNLTEDGISETLTAALSLSEARLEVATTPPGLMVLVDGQPEGRSPILLRDMVPGRAYDIIVCGNQYVQVVRYVAERGTTTLKLEPKRVGARSHQIRITSRPAGARVRLDGKRSGKTPTRVSIQAGTYHHLKLSWRRRKTAERHVCFKRPPATIRLVRNLPRSKSATLELQLAPACTVAVDRKTQGRAGRKFRLTRLAPGKHTLLFKSSDPPIWHLTEVNLHAGQTLKLKLEFSADGLGPLLKSWDRTASR